jgi:predicted secreted protein
MWFNYIASFKILIFGLVLGAGLPALFAVGVRMSAEGVGVADHGGTVSGKNPALVALSYVIFALVLAAVIVGVLFVARDFIGHHTGVYMLGAQAPKGH